MLKIMDLPDEANTASEQLGLFNMLMAADPHVIVSQMAYIVRDTQRLERMAGMLKPLSGPVAPLPQTAVPGVPVMDLSPVQTAKSIPSTIKQALRLQEEAAQIRDNATRDRTLSEIALATLKQLTGLSGKTVSEITGDDKRAAMVNGALRRGKIEFDSLAGCIDDIARTLTEGQPKAMREQAANVMMGLPWAEPQSFRQRVAFAVEHGQSFKDFAQAFRRQERKAINAAFKRNPLGDTARIAASSAFRAFLSEGMGSGKSITRQQFTVFHDNQKEMPSADALNHIGRKMGAQTADDLALFRKLVFGYPIEPDLRRDDRAIDAALEQLQHAGSDKSRCAEAYKAMEKALVYRDGLREHKLHHDIAAAAYEYAMAQDAQNPSAERLLPASPKVTPRMLEQALDTHVRQGGEILLHTAKIIAAYIAQSDSVREQQWLDAIAPHKLTQTPFQRMAQAKAMNMPVDEPAAEVAPPVIEAAPIKSERPVQRKAITQKTLDNVYRGPEPHALILKMIQAAATGNRLSKTLETLRKSQPEGHKTAHEIAKEFGTGADRYLQWESNGKLPAAKIDTAIRVFSIPEAFHDDFKKAFTASFAASDKAQPAQPPKRRQDDSDTHWEELTRRSRLKPYSGRE
jgi:cell pole-organizing protein PopZ